MSGVLCDKRVPLHVKGTRGISVDGTTGGRCQASYAIREYHYMLKEQEESVWMEQLEEDVRRPMR